MRWRRYDSHRSLWEEAGLGQARSVSQSTNEKSKMNGGDEEAHLSEESEAHFSEESEAHFSEESDDVIYASVVGDQDEEDNDVVVHNANHVVNSKAVLDHHKGKESGLTCLTNVFTIVVLLCSFVSLSLSLSHKHSTFPHALRVS